MAASIENAPLLRLGLFSPRFQERLPAPAVHRREPLLRIRNHRLQQHALRHPPHSHRVPFKAEFSRQPHRLAAPILKKFRHSTLSHGRLQSWYISHIYTTSLSTRQSPPPLNC